MEVVSHPKGKRLGGRSARINEAVLTATFQLLAEAGLKNFSIRAVSARANVHETSIYRRWGTPQSLILEACLHFMENAIPIEDTGLLRSDLVAISKRAMATLGGPQGKVVLALIRLADEKIARSQNGSIGKLGSAARSQSSTGQSLVENSRGMPTPSSCFKL